MTSSFRLDPELESLLQRIINSTGQSRSQIIRQALSKYCSELVAATDKSPYQRLMEAGFKPIDDGDDADLSSNQQARRKKLRESAARDNR